MCAMAGSGQHFAENLLFLFRELVRHFDRFKQAQAVRYCVRYIVNLTTYVVRVEMFAPFCRILKPSWRKPKCVRVAKDA